MEFQLRERVAIIIGELTTTVQSLMVGMTAEGADVALIGPNADTAEKFCGQLNDQREVKAKHGRAVALKADVTDTKIINECVGRVAQSFGGVDVLIDAQLWNKPSKVNIDSQVVDLDEVINRNLKSTLTVTQIVVGYLKSRKKGRLIYLMNDSVLKAMPEDAFQNATRSGLILFSQSLAKQLLEHNVTVNVLSLGVTEEYLLAHYDGLSLKDALAKLKVFDPYIRFTEPDKITNSIIYLVGQSGSAVTGQLIRLV